MGGKEEDFSSSGSMEHGLVGLEAVLWEIKSYIYFRNSLTNTYRHQGRWLHSEEATVASMVMLYLQGHPWPGLLCWQLLVHCGVERWYWYMDQCPHAKVLSDTSHHVNIGHIIHRPVFLMSLRLAQANWWWRQNKKVWLKQTSSSKLIQLC